MIITDFINTISEHQGFHIERLRLTPKNRSVYELSGNMNCLLSLHYISHRPYRWGVTANVIEELQKQTKPWVVVLFFNSYQTGYLLSSSDVLDYISKKIWPLAKDGDYKPAAPGSYLANNTPFNSFDDFLARLSFILSATTNIQTAIEDAVKQADTLRRRGTGESTKHRNLKNYIKEHPECVGLDGTVFATTEYPFPSGDRVDVAFESSGNSWTVIEVEQEGLAQTIIGLFQAVKYKALQEAVLVSKSVQGSVDAVLVAKSIPVQVKTLAEVLKIKTFEISI